MSQATVAEATGRAIHPMDEVLPSDRLAIYGFQHMLAFLIANLRLQDQVEPGSGGGSNAAVDPAKGGWQ